MKITLSDFLARAWAICVLFGIIGVLLKKPFGVTACVMIAIMWTLTRIIAEAIATYENKK